MAKSKYSRKTSEERKQEIKELSEKAFAEIERYSTSPESLLEYAEFLSRFHSYSLNNIALIQNQFKGAVAVASYKDWNDKGYSVLKGEKGIEIFSYTPVTLFKDADGNTKRLSEATKDEKQLIQEGKITTRKISHYSKGNVFDISQTNAPIKDLPKIFPNKQFNFKIEEGNNAAHLLKGIEAVAKDLDIEIKDMRMSSLGYTELGTAKGAFIQNTIDPSKKEIVLNSRNTPTQNLATAIHELAHAKMHYKGSDMEYSNTATLEFQAELTSYIVCKHYGMDTSEKAIPYIARWTNNGQKLEDKQKAIEGVHKTAAEFIETMDLVISHEKELDQSLNIESYNKIPDNHKDLYPTDEAELIYCDLTGKAIAQDEEYYHLENGLILSEEGKKLVFTDKEWEKITINEEDNYRATCFYDVDQKDMTTKEPERKIDQDIYYYYDGQSEPLKLGTASDIIAATQNKESIGHFSYNHELIRDFTLAKNEDKFDFNKQMQKHNILKNPGIKDFEKINDRLVSREDWDIQRLNRLNLKLLPIQLKKELISTVSSNTNFMIYWIGLIIVVYFGAKQVQIGTMSLGTLIAFTTYLMSLFGPINAFLNLNVELQRCIGGAKRIFEIFEVTKEVKNGNTETNGLFPIIFKNVNHSFDRRCVLNNINFEINKGETIAIIGESGNGKSTLINILLGLYTPQSGTISVNGTNITQLNKESYSDKVAAVFQDSNLFTGTVKDNIRFGNLSASQNEIIHAAKLANAHDFIERLPQGYDTVIGEQFVNLSGGQKQRIAIARALVKRAELLILDEATSALDYNTERGINFTVLPYQTTIVVTHRLENIKGLDKIYIINEGKLLRFSSYEEAINFGLSVSSSS